MGLLYLIYIYIFIYLFIYLFEVLLRGREERIRILKGTLGLQIGKTFVLESVFLLAECEARFAEKARFVVSGDTVRNHLHLVR